MCTDLCACACVHAAERAQARVCSPIVLEQVTWINKNRSKITLASGTFKRKREKARMNWRGRYLSKHARSGQTSRLYFKSARGSHDPRLRPGRELERGHAGPDAGTPVRTLAHLDPTRAHLTRRGHAGPDAGHTWTRRGRRRPDAAPVRTRARLTRTRAGRHFRPLVAVLYQGQTISPAAFKRRTVRAGGHTTPGVSSGRRSSSTRRALRKSVRAPAPARDRRRQNARQRAAASLGPPAIPSRVAAWPPTCPQVRAGG